MFSLSVKLFYLHIVHLCICKGIRITFCTVFAVFCTPLIFYQSHGIFHIIHDVLQCGSIIFTPERWCWSACDLGAFRGVEALVPQSAVGWLAGLELLVWEELSLWRSVLPKLLHLFSLVRCSVPIRMDYEVVRCCYSSTLMFCCAKSSIKRRKLRR